MEPLFCEESSRFAYLHYDQWVFDSLSMGTEKDGSPEWNKNYFTLQDMVTAYEMQNRFLNKEVLELNHLKQQACDREQKLYL